MSEEQKVVLTDDQKAVAIRGLQQLLSAVRHVYDTIIADDLTEEMRETMLSLIEHYTADIAEPLGYDSKTKTQIESRFHDIRQANNTIAQLREQLADRAEITGVGELLGKIERLLDRWWNEQGFSFVGDVGFHQLVCKARFCLRLNEEYSHSQTPITGKEQRENLYKQMIDDGYEFTRSQGDDVLLDTPSNRSKITAIIKAQFPSVRILQWNNRSTNKQETFYLRDFEARIEINDFAGLLEKEIRTESVD